MQIIDLWKYVTVMVFIGKTLHHTEVLQNCGISYYLYKEYLRRRGEYLTAQTLFTKF